MVNLIKSNNISLNGVGGNLTPLNAIGLNTTTKKSGNGKLLKGNFLSFSCPSEAIFYIEYTHDSPYIEYSLDGKNWKIIDKSSNFVEFGGKKHLYVRGINETFSDGNEYSKFTLISRRKDGIYCEGNVMTLLDYRNPPMECPDYCFEYLFEKCDIITPPELPATTLGAYCYSYMFFQCLLLQRMPELPSMELSEGCYSNMFSDCDSLTEVCDLYAPVIPTKAYQEMFDNCNKLEKAPIIYATSVIGSDCMKRMFAFCGNLEQIECHVIEPKGTTTEWLYYSDFKEGVLRVPYASKTSYPNYDIIHNWRIEYF